MHVTETLIAAKNINFTYIQHFKCHNIVTISMLIVRGSDSTLNTYFVNQSVKIASQHCSNLNQFMAHNS